MYKWGQYSISSDNIAIYEEIFEDLQIWDCHTHIGKDKDRHVLYTSKLLKLMNESKVKKSLVFPLNDPEDNKKFAKSNTRIHSAYKKHPDRFVPFFRLNPKYPWKEEFEKRVSQGFKGVKLHPRSQRFKFNSAKAMKIYEAAEKHNLALLLHMGFGLEDIAVEFKKIVRQFPKLRIIIGHSGFVDLTHVIKLVGQFDNVLFDTSAVKIFDMFELLSTVDYRKIAFGSDIPYYDIDLALEALIDTSIMLKKTPNQIKHYLGLNTMRWFKDD